MFKVGDRVIVKVFDPLDNNIVPNGTEGIVCADDEFDKTIGVDFGKNVYGHSCLNNCAVGQGWWFHRDTLELKITCKDEDKWGRNDA